MTAEFLSKPEQISLAEIKLDGETSTCAIVDTGK